MIIYGIITYSGSAYCCSSSLPLLISNIIDRYRNLFWAAPLCSSFYHRNTIHIPVFDRKAQAWHSSYKQHAPFSSTKLKHLLRNMWRIFFLNKMCIEIVSKAFIFFTCGEGLYVYLHFSFRIYIALIFIPARSSIWHTKPCSILHDHITTSLYRDRRLNVFQ